MQLEEFKDLRLSKRQYNKLARTILNRHHQKEVEERRNLEARAKTYSIQELQEVLEGTGINEEEIKEVIKEKFGKNSEVVQTIKKITPIIYGTCAGINLGALALSFTLYASNGRKENLIAGLINTGINTGLLMYNSFMTYKSYKKLHE